MAQIVCIAEGTFNKDINNLDDIVSIHDDDVDLTGKAYDTFKIYSIKGVTAKEIQNKFSVMKPEIKKFWVDSDNAMYELKSEPKYQISMSTIDNVDKAKLLDSKTGTTEVSSILDKAQINLKVITENKETELIVKTVL